MSKKVFLGIGHGGSDPGAVANGFEEKDLNLAIGLACRGELERHGVQVLMSRTKDENDPLAEEYPTPQHSSSIHPLRASPNRDTSVPWSAHTYL